MSSTQSAPGDQERYSRRLSDKIQAAFDHACDEGDLIVATELLETLELVLLRTPPRPERREVVVAPLLASHERLWHLKTGGQSANDVAEAEAPSNTPED
ncbi:MAG: hypothetical protein WDN04_24725 [Rhodospirillales bacterium]